MVIDDADGLHPGVDNDGADEFEAALFESLRYFFRDGRLRWNGAGVLDRLSACHAPNPLREIFVCGLHGKIDASAVDRGFDFGAGADDARILKEARDIGFLEAGDFGWIEVLEGLAERIALAQNDDPGEAGLKAFEHEGFPKGAAVVFRNAPFFVMVGPVDGVAYGPGAALDLAFG